jgi:hypothetical protein
MSDTLQAIINKLWIAPDNAEWTPRADTVSLRDVREWFKSDDIEVQGFTSALVHDARFRIEPPLTPTEYGTLAMHYYERCLKEDPKGQWADSRYSAGSTLVNVFAALWRDSSVPRDVPKELKTWLGRCTQRVMKVFVLASSPPPSSIFLSRRTSGSFFLTGRKTQCLR